MNGRDYHFVSPETFQQMVEKGAFAEWAEVHGNRYGTAISTLELARQEGHDLLLDIDCQGAEQLRGSYDLGVSIFILPPSLEELERRLVGRNTDEADVIRRRVANARVEIREMVHYDYLVINDDFQKALDELRAIIVAEGCRTARVLDQVRGLFGL